MFKQLFKRDVEVFKKQTAVYGCFKQVFANFFAFKQLFVVLKKRYFIERKQTLLSSENKTFLNYILQNILCFGCLPEKKRLRK